LHNPIEIPLDNPGRLLYALSIAAVFLVVRSVLFAREHERLAILRLGRFIGTRGPGLVMIIPFLDRVVRINLDQDVPNWRGLSAEQLEQDLEQRVTAS